MLCWYATTAGEGREEALSSGGLDLIIVPGLGFTKVLTLKICSLISRPLHPRIQALFSLLCAGGESAWPRKGIGFAALHIGLFDIYICFSRDIMIRTLPNVSRLASGLKLWVSINSLVPFSIMGRWGRRDKACVLKTKCFCFSPLLQHWCSALSCVREFP